MVSEREDHRPGIAVFTLVVILFSCKPGEESHGRSAHPLIDAVAASTSNFDAERSAALFVGIQKFDDPRIAPVPYAADDAVDLAYTFAIEPQRKLVKASRVVIAIRGVPQKKESKKRLDELLQAGAIRSGASETEILDALEHQTKSVGNEGILIVSFATHGFSSDGVPYVLTASSRLNQPDTALQTTRILDIAASGARRSLIFLDACRERLTSTRSIARPPSAAPLLSAMGKTAGQVVFYAAAAGKFAYDDESRKNGVFTEYVVAGLRCNAKNDERGVITVTALNDYVEPHVRAWLKRHHKELGPNATQINMDGGTGQMAVAFCPPPPRCKASPARTETDGTTVRAFDGANNELWRHDMNDAVAYARVDDLDDDDCSEVVVAAGSTVTAFDAEGNARWSADTRMPIRRLAINSLFRQDTRQIVTLSAGNNGNSRVTVLERDGKVRGSYLHPGLLQHLAIGRPTARFNMKIIVAGLDRSSSSRPHTRGTACVFALDPKKLAGEQRIDASRAEAWYGHVLPPDQRIEKLQIFDHDQDTICEIELTTSGGRIYLDFDGRMLKSDGGDVTLIHHKRRR